MGLKYFILMVFSGTLLFLSTYCSNKNGNINEHELFICGQTSPQWFKDEIRKIADNSPMYKPIKVFLVNDENGTEYIAIEDHAKTSSNKLKVFLCTGVEIEPCEAKYSTIVQKYEKNETKIIWPE